MAPFMKKDDQGNSRINGIRIVEAVISSIIVSVLTTGALMWAGQKVIGQKVEDIKCTVSEIKSGVNVIDDRVRTVEIKFAAHEARRSH